MILSPREAASKVNIATAVSARVGQVDKRPLLCSSKARRPNYWKDTPCATTCSDHRLAPWLTKAGVFVRAVAVMVVGLVDNIALLLKPRTSPASLEMKARSCQRVGAAAPHLHEL